MKYEIHPDNHKKGIDKPLLGVQWIGPLSWNPFPSCEPSSFFKFLESTYYKSIPFINTGLSPIDTSCWKGLTYRCIAVSTWMNPFIALSSGWLRSQMQKICSIPLFSAKLFKYLRRTARYLGFLKPMGVRHHCFRVSPTFGIRGRDRKLREMFNRNPIPCIFKLRAFRVIFMICPQSQKPKQAKILP